MSKNKFITKESDQLSFLNKLDINEVLNSFDIAVADAQVNLGMVDGIKDTYEDETGINTSESSGQNFDNTNKLYKNGQDTSNLRLLLSLNGLDGATNTVDDSPSNHTINFNGTAQLDTDEKKFGSSSLLLDGDSDYLTIADSGNWDILASNSQTYTIHLWVRHSDISSTQYYLRHFENGSNNWSLRFATGLGVAFFSTGGALNTGNGGNILQDTFHHIAVVIIGNGSSKAIGLYVDGDQVGYDTTSTNLNFTAPLYIGQNGDDGSFLNGHLDEVIVDNSNYFNASPNPGLTDTITIPTSEFSSVENMILISDTFTADSIPEEATIIIMEEDIDTIIENTDLIASISRDNGTTFSQVTLSEEGILQSGKRILSGTVDLTSQPSGQDMIYKIQTFNLKALNIHATGLLWN